MAEKESRPRRLRKAETPDDFMGLEIPDEELARQAVASLRGYVYQIYQTLNAWLALKEGETLLLEVAEDFAVLAKDAMTATQVKDTAASASVTLRTKSVADTINSLWRFQNANPDKSVRINYLTTSEIGMETGLTFPDGHSGLSYWSIASQEWTDIEPLRQALLNLNLLPEVAEFLKTESPDVIKDKIVGRISWVCGAHDIESLRQVIHERLASLGQPLGLAASDSERAEDPLVCTIFRTITCDTSRVLSRANLLRILGNSATVTMPITAIRQLFAKVASQAGSDVPTDLSTGTGIVVNAARVPLPPQVTKREELVSRLTSVMGHSGALWLHGSSGLGKSVLAQLIARQSKRDWLLVELRDRSREEVEFRLSRLLQTVQSSGLGGVILDDFPTQHAQTMRLRLSMLVEEVHRVGGTAIVTAAKPPSPNAESCFGPDGPSVVDVPYLTREEVGELITLAGGDAEKWAGVVHTLCGFGHPQLVQVRISGLRRRDWPEDDILGGLVTPAKEVDDERVATRERLLHELPEDGRELLYRLTLVAGYFDRETATSLAQLDPAVSRPGEILDMLCGPWIEKLASDRYGISPLLSGAGGSVLGNDKQADIHRHIVEHLIARRPFPADFLGTVLNHALASRHGQGLLWLTMIVMNARNRDRGAIAEELFLLPLLDAHDGKPLFEENPLVSAILRVAQFRVATWAHRTDRLPAIADQVLIEARMIDQTEIGQGLLYAGIGTILMEMSLDIRPSKWMPLIVELQSLTVGKEEIIDSVRKLNAEVKGRDGWDVPQFLFALRAKSLKSTGELVELFAELDALEQVPRDLLLSSLDNIPHGKRLMVDVAWLSETRAGHIDGPACAEVYRELAQLAEAWGIPEIAVHCECAGAVMLNEYADDPKAALTSLDKADLKYPNDRRLLRERAKVQYDRGDYLAALATSERMVDSIPEDDHIERAFAFREAAIGAAKIGRVSKAGDYFAEASSAARAASGPGMPRMAVGLKADCALCKFQTADATNAVRLMSEAIIEAESLDPKADAKAEFCSRVLMAMILWMQAEVEKTSPPQPEFPAVIGNCSIPDPPDKALETPCPPLLASWYQLALLELKLGIDCGILCELAQRTSEQKILVCELTLNHYVMAKHVTSVDIDGLVSYLPDYAARTVHMIAEASNIAPQDIYQFTEASLPAISPMDWESELYLQHAKDAILALTATALCSEAEDFIGRLSNCLDQDRAAAVALRFFISCFQEETRPKGEFFEMMAFHLGRLMKPIVSPDELFLLTFHVWDWLPQTQFMREIEGPVADYLAHRWQRVTVEQRFGLRQPILAVPAIETAIAGPAGGIAKLAEIILAAEIAVKPGLSAETRLILQNKHIKKQPSQ